MSMVLMVEAMKAKVGNPGRKLVLLKLADNANDKGECWPSYQHIADHTEMGRSTVKAHIKQLEDDGYLVKCARNDGKSSNQYLLTIGQGETKERQILTRSNPDPVSIEPGQDLDATRSDPDPVTRSDPDPRTSHSSEPVTEPVTTTASDVERAVPRKSHMTDRDGVTLNDDWQPTADTVVRMARLGIPESFSAALVAEFVTHWLTANHLPERCNWDTAFLKRGKHCWEKRQSEIARTVDAPSWQFEDHDWSVLFSAGGMADEINPDHIRGWLKQCELARVVIDQTRIATVAEQFAEAERLTAVPIPMLVEEVYVQAWSRFKADWLVNKFGLCQAARAGLKGKAA